MGNYWEMDHTRTINRMIERIHTLGLPSGWRDRDAEGFTRAQLLSLRVHGALDRAALLGDMRARGHDDEALKQLDRLIDKTYLEAGQPYPEVQA
jgi:hypothetical protein